MSQQSEERLPESASADADPLPTARILPMKTRQSDLQRAIQQRAQESVERERDLDLEQRRPKPLKWLIITAIAAIPVLLTLTAVDGFLRAMHRYIEVAAKSPQPQSSEPAPETVLQSSEPGVVLLQPLTPPTEVPAEAAAPEAATTGSAANAQQVMAPNK